MTCGGRHDLHRPIADPPYQGAKGPLLARFALLLAGLPLCEERRAASDELPGKEGARMIDTARLTLRRPEDSDWPAYRAYRLSSRSTSPMSEGEAWTHFAALFGHWALRGFGRLVATLQGRPIGHFGPFFPAGHPERELTWTLWDPALEGQGFAFEAAAAARDHAFGALGWASAVSYIDPANTRSQALAARLGAVRDPAAPNPYGDATQVWRHGRGVIA